MVQPLSKMSEMGFAQGYAADENELNTRGATWVNFGPKDDNTVVAFYWKDVLNRQKSREMGRPFYDKEIFVRSHHPGEERLEERDVPATEEHKRRWPRQWFAFQQNRAFVPEGTPIDYLFPANPEIGSMLRWHGFHTVELLAKASPVAIESVGMGMQDWVNKAKKYQEDAQKGVDHHKIKELEERHAREIKALQNQIADLVSKINLQQTAANNLGVGQQADLGRLLNPAREAPMPDLTPRAMPDVSFLDEEDLPDQPMPAPSPRGAFKKAQSERMKEMWRKRKAAQQEN